MLQADLAAGVEEGLEVLVVVVQVVLAAEQRLDELGVRARRLRVLPSSAMSSNSPRRLAMSPDGQRLAFEGR